MINKTPKITPKIFPIITLLDLGLGKWLDWRLDLVRCKFRKTFNRPQVRARGLGQLDVTTNTPGYLESVLKIRRGNWDTVVEITSNSLSHYRQVHFKLHGLCNQIP